MMTYSKKYGRTFHYPFSPGSTNDDRINYEYWEDISRIPQLIHTEKMDGENNCLNKYGVFARSHAAPSVSPWTGSIRQKWELIKHDLGDYEIFGENLFAIHSIAYTNLHDHFFAFAVRENDVWLSWEETCFIAAAFDLPVVPIAGIIDVLSGRLAFEQQIIELASGRSAFDSIDVSTQQPCQMEGIVTRNMAAYGVGDFSRNVFKYVRKGHVTTDEHWTKNWKRAPLKNERK